MDDVTIIKKWYDMSGVAYVDFQDSINKKYQFNPWEIISSRLVRG
jgi:hypothetical protein